MATSTTSADTGLTVPERNRFFYGKLMDVPQFEKDMRYVNDKRWLLNRLVLGSGVVRGLDVTPGAQPNSTLVTIQPGLAIDPFGREIVVPSAVTVDSSQPTDDQGAPVGPWLTNGPVEICLAYAEGGADLEPVLVPDCGGPGTCVYGTTREGFRIIVRIPTVPPPLPPACLLGGPPLSGDIAFYAKLGTRLSLPFPVLPVDSTISLAQVTLAGGASPTIDPRTSRPLVYGNALLYETILCLAVRVEQLGDALILRYVAGDNQSGHQGAAVAKPIVVKLTDVGGAPKAGTVVQFTPTAGSGTATPLTTKTDKAGNAHTTWTLGTAMGTQQITAAAVGSSFTVTFTATAT
jgi:hypothetical protein